LELLAQNPRPQGVEKLRANPAFWRLWIGRDHRMIYTIDDKMRVVVVALVRNRADAYRGLERLNAASLIQAIQPLLSQPRPPGRNQ
jgi:hypothetical protein